MDVITYPYPKLYAGLANTCLVKEAPENIIHPSKKSIQQVVTSCFMRSLIHYD